MNRGCSRSWITWCYGHKLRIHHVIPAMAKKQPIGSFLLWRSWTLEEQRYVCSGPTEFIQQCDIFSLFRQQQKNLLTNHNSWRARRGEIATFLIYRKSIWIVAAFPNGLSNTKTCIQNRKKGIVGTKASSSASPLLRTSSKGINYLARCRKLLYTLQL